MSDSICNFTPAIAEEPQENELGDGMTYKREIGEILHPEREPLWVLDGLKVNLGSPVFSAQYQQEPVPRDGTLVKRDWLRYYRQLPERDSNDWSVQSWDTASKTGKSNDYSVCTTWLVRDNVYHLMDVLRERLQYPDLKRRMIVHAAAYDADVVLIEDASSGAGLIQDLFDDGRIHPIAMRPEGDKVIRLEKRSAVIEAGQVRLPESAPWLGDFVDEVLAFPNGRFDDQVDSLSQFLTWVRERQDTFGIAGF